LLRKACDAHRKVSTSLPDDPAEGVTVSLALEEDLAPLDRLVPMPLVRTLRLERQVRLSSHSCSLACKQLTGARASSPPSRRPCPQESFPSASGPLSPDDDFPATSRLTHARTPSLSFSSTSSAFSTHAQGSPASQTVPDFGPNSGRARTGSTLSLKTQFDVGAKPFFPASHSPSALYSAGGDGDEGANDHGDVHRRPSLQGIHGLGFSSTGDGVQGLYEGVSDFELSNLGLLGTGAGGASVVRIPLCSLICRRTPS
jgi:hypothetical protein